MKRFALILISLSLVNGCYGEFDVPKTPRKDCMGQTQNQYIYVLPTCRPLPKKHPKDFEL